MNDSQFRFASTRHKIYFTIGLLFTAFTGLLMPLNQILGGLVAEEYLQQPNVFFALFSKSKLIPYQAEGNESVLAAVMVIVYIYVAGTVIQFLFNFVQVRVAVRKCMMYCIFSNISYSR